MIQGQDNIRDAYRDATVAREYVDRRFVEPLGALLHARQVGHLIDVVRRVRPTQVLEIAPGPGRLTADLAPALPRPGTLVDASAQMLAEARVRLRAAHQRGWHLVQGDAFQLPLRGGFDLIYTFRLIRHFDAADRARLYSGLARLMKAGGVLVFDAVNERAAMTVRGKPGGEGQHYDALLTAELITRELTAAGFTRVQFAGVQHHYSTLYRLQVLAAPRSRWLARRLMEIVDRTPGGHPLEWIVTCERGPEEP